MNLFKKAWLRSGRGIFLSFVLVLTSCRLELEEKSPNEDPKGGQLQKNYLGNLGEIDEIEFQSDIYSVTEAGAFDVVWNFRDNKVIFKGECSTTRDMTSAESEVFQKTLETTDLCLLVGLNDVTPVQQRTILPPDIIKFVWNARVVEIYDAPMDYVYGDFLFCSEQSFSFLRRLTGMLRRPEDGACLDHAD